MANIQIQQKGPPHGAGIGAGIGSVAGGIIGGILGAAGTYGFGTAAGVAGGASLGGAIGGGAGSYSDSKQKEAPKALETSPLNDAMARRMSAMQTQPSMQPLDDTAVLQNSLYASNQLPAELRQQVQPLLAAAYYKQTTGGNFNGGQNYG